MARRNGPVCTGFSGVRRMLDDVKASDAPAAGDNGDNRDEPLRRQRTEAKPPLDASFRDLVQGMEDYAIFLLDATGHVATWNAGAAKIKGYAADEIIGEHFSRFYTEEANSRGWPSHELREAARAGRFEDEGWRVRKDGKMFWASVVITALRDRHGELTGFAKITRDLTDRRRQLEDLRQSEERFRLLVESVSDYAIFMLDPTGHVMSWNAGAANMKGYSRDEIVGRHFSTFYPADDVLAGKPERELAMARQLGRVEYEGWRVRKDGSTFWAYVTLTAVYDEGNRLRGFAKVTRDMTAQRQREQLAQSDERMKRFIAVLAHELRNPLAPVRNAISVMQLESSLSTTLARSRDLIDRQITHLTRLVDDLLDVGRIVSGKIELRIADAELGEIVARGVEAARPFTEAHEQICDVQLPDEPMFVKGDITRLVQVVQNLLHNASKFSPGGSRIVVRARMEDRIALLQVCDSGCGIAAGNLESIFEMFVQEKRGMKSGECGLGIGLSLCQSLIAMHGGTISAASDGPGRGSTFTVRLPLADRSQATTDQKTDEQAATTALRVLVVDDNRDSADSLAMMLELMGHDVRITYDGAQALQVAHRFSPQVAVIDIAMPNMDGYAVLSALRALPRLANTLFAAMTGFGSESDLARTREAGFEAHLLKPVDLASFEALLARAMKRYRNR
jgi:PAS domain S-box-containing protein